MKMMSAPRVWDIEVRGIENETRVGVVGEGEGGRQESGREQDGLRSGLGRNRGMSIMYKTTIKLSCHA